MSKKVFPIIFLVLILVLGFHLTVFATETNYPEIPGVETPDEESFPRWITYAFSFSLILGTMVVTGSLIYGGFLYLTAAGNPTRTNEASNRISSALVGLLILLSSYLILTTINPDLVVFRLGDIEPVDEDGGPSGPPQTMEAEEYQEVPIGTLLEKILAKNIGCYKGTSTNGKMVDCQDRKVVEIGPVNSYDKREGYCYAFNDKYNFKDADDEKDGVNPMTDHDRLDCIKRLQEPVNVRMEKLKKWSEKIRELTSNCSTKNCDVDGNCIDGTCDSPSCERGTCKKRESCVGKPYESGRDPCLSRDQIDHYRKLIQRNYKDDELKEDLSTKDFNERATIDPEDYSGEGEPLLVADQVRYLMLNFLKPLEKDLENDLESLRKAENKLKFDSPYWSTLTHAQLVSLRTQKKPEEIEIKDFQETNTGQEVEITEYCKDFNCEDCEDDEGEKLPCDECDLDQLEQGNCTTTTVGGREITSCKCSNYLLNNQEGENFTRKESCEDTDKKCKLCRIEDEHEEDEDEEETECYLRNDDPATFYYPSSELQTQRGSEAMVSFECKVDPYPDNTYPQGQIPIGQAVDRGEEFGQEILGKLENINKQIKIATEALYNPYDPAGDLITDPPQGDLSVLYILPLSCRCQNNPDDYWGAMHSEAYCDVVGAGGCCNPCDCEEPPCGCCGIRPDVCKCKCKIENPCLMGKINNRVNEVVNARETIKDSFERIIDLALERDLEDDDPKRTEMINKLARSREAMEKAITGYHKVREAVMARNRIMSCSVALDLIQLEEVKISPDFPIKGYQNCYPFNSEKLTPPQRQQCLESKESDECLNNTENFMNNYFWCQR